MKKNELRLPQRVEAMSRRDLLRLAGASIVIDPSILGGGPMSSVQMVSAKEAADHLILGAADLDKAITWLENKAGVKAVIGGVHPGRGTRNALISLGGRQYLEILAPDPAQKSVSPPFDLSSLAAPRLINWAAVTDDIASVARRARAEGLTVSDPRDGSRARPDGRMLKWKSMDVQNRSAQVILIPFFIEWATGSLHPSQDSPGGCELKSLEMEHPDPEVVTGTLRKLGIDAKVKKANEARLRAVLKTPKGDVELS